jgi:cytochrome c oxidase cbb3-type subunit 3
MKPAPDELLNHEADGIREFDNALPRWWLYGFYFTIAFAVVYLVNYHVLETPLFGEANIVAEYDAAVAAARRPTDGQPPTPVAAITLRQDPASLSAGKAIFEGASLCATCHRPDLGGIVGPNLTDDLWLHGCTPADVARNISTGFPPQGMLPYGTGTPLTHEQLVQLVSYVLSMTGSNPPNPKAADPVRDQKCG